MCRDIRYHYHLAGSLCGVADEFLAASLGTEVSISSRLSDRRGQATNCGCRGGSDVQKEKLQPQGSVSRCLFILRQRTSGYTTDLPSRHVDSLVIIVPSGSLMVSFSPTDVLINLRADTPAGGGTCTHGHRHRPNQPQRPLMFSAQDDTQNARCRYTAPVLQSVVESSH